MNKKTRSQVKQLLLSFRQAMNDIDIVPLETYQSLKQALIRKEMQEELEFLETLLYKHDSNIVYEFRERCKQRSQANADTAICFSMLPQGDTNRLYFELARVLLQPANLYELMTLLHPRIKSVLVIEPCQKTPYFFNHLDRLNYLRQNPFTLRLQPVSTLKSIKQLHQFSKFITLGDICFDTQALQPFDFNAHILFYNLLSRQFPKYHRRLYANFQFFQELEDDILYYLSKGQSLYLALCDLSKGFIMGSKELEGSEEHASTSAYLALIQFYRFFNPLPEILKKEVLAMACERGLSFETMLDNLKDASSPKGCVHTFAGDLSSIITNKAYRKLLSYTPELTNQKLKDLKIKYTPYSHKIYDSPSRATLLPETLLVKTLSESDIRHAEDLLFILIVLPASLYHSFLQSTPLAKQEIFLTKVARGIKNKLFNREQESRLVQAITPFISELPDGYNALHLCGNSNHYDLATLGIKRFLGGKPFLTNEQCKTLQPLIIHFIKYPVTFKVIFEHIVPDQRYELLMMPTSAYECMYECILEHQKSFLYAFKTLPPDDRLKCMLEENQIMRACISHKDWFINDKNLHPEDFCNYYIEIMAILWSYYDERRWDAFYDMICMTRMSSLFYFGYLSMFCGKLTVDHVSYQLYNI